VEIDEVEEEVLSESEIADCNIAFPCE